LWVQNPPAKEVMGRVRLQNPQPIGLRRRILSAKDLRAIAASTGRFERRQE
jgi:hypothetical protein